MKESIDVVLAWRLIKYCMERACAGSAQCLPVWYAGKYSFIAVFVSGKERVIILLHKSSSMGNPEKHIKHKNK